jgi:hypothetical protein
MAIVSLTAIQLKPGARWEDAQKSIKAGNDLVRKHGGENVTAMVTMLAGEATGTVTTLWTASNWSVFGMVQNALMADPEVQALMAESTGPNGSTLGWSTYVSQTIPDM